MCTSRKAVQIILLAAVIPMVSGCYCRFRAFPASAEGGTLCYDDADEVPLPLIAPASIPIFYETGGEASGLRAVELPNRDHETIGAVMGMADDDWPTTVVESNLRRAAHAVQADAVVLTTPLVFSKLHSGYTYYGRMIRWRDSPDARRSP